MSERLTFEGNFCEIARCRETRWGKHCPDGACSQRKVWERLKEYEDAADGAPVRNGRWLLQANNERTNYRWNVTAECSECCDEEKEIWAGFFPNVPDWLARDVALESAKSVKLSNYCPNCGAKMDGADEGGHEEC